MARTRKPRCSRNPARRQVGAISVEFALVVPILVLVIIGGVHFGRVLMIRHKLGEATNYATRSAAIQRNTNANRIRSLIQSRMGSDSGCTRIRVRARTRTDGIGTRRLEVTTECRVDTGIGGALLGAVGPDQLDVTVAMPL
jgi:Flp pilus assembly protein TadG